MKREEEKRKHLETMIDKLSRDRQDLHEKIKSDSKSMMEKFRSLND